MDEKNPDIASFASAAGLGADQMASDSHCTAFGTILANDDSGGQIHQSAMPGAHHCM